MWISLDKFEKETIGIWTSKSKIEVTFLQYILSMFWVVELLAHVVHFLSAGHAL